MTTIRAQIAILILMFISYGIVLWTLDGFVKDERWAEASLSGASLSLILVVMGGVVQFIATP